MKKNYYKQLVSVETHQRLAMSKNKLQTADNRETYSVVSGVPIMLPDTVKAKWQRELIEVILWEHPDEIEKIYKELEKTTDYSEVYIKYIRRLLKNKEGITEAFEKYSAANTDKWVAINSDKTVTLMQKIKFKKYTSKSIGKKRTVSKINGTGIFEPYPYFGKTVTKNSPQTIVELGTGAGGGTAATALHMTDNAVLFTVDIGFECLGNAIGIRKYQKKNLFPVCANFWYLPFADNSADAVCTYNGFDESRENERTLSEISRILKNGGTFTITSRKNAFMRQARVLEPFGFTNDEVIGIMKKCRLYSDISTLDEECKKFGLKLNSRKEFIISTELTYVVSEYTISK